MIEHKQVWDWVGALGAIGLLVGVYVMIIALTKTAAKTPPAKECTDSNCGCSGYHGSHF